MERELRLVIIDSDYGYIKQMEEALIRRFRSRAQIQIITDPAYLDVYFRTPRTIDILVADQSTWKNTQSIIFCCWFRRWTSRRHFRTK